MAKNVTTYPPISAYALIAEGRTAAPIGCDGSIDWMCYGRFNAPAVSCRLLDAQKSGCFQIAPQTPHETSRRYLPNRNVLETTFHPGSKIVRVTDAMPLRTSLTWR